MLNVHEYGHYVVAKACKVKVDTFPIGFGPEILILMIRLELGGQLVYWTIL